MALTRMSAPKGDLDRLGPKSARVKRRPVHRHDGEQSRRVNDAPGNLFQESSFRRTFRLDLPHLIVHIKVL